MVPTCVWVKLYGAVSAIIGRKGANDATAMSFTLQMTETTMTVSRHRRGGGGDVVRLVEGVKGCSRRLLNVPKRSPEEVESGGLIDCARR